VPLSPTDYAALSALVFENDRHTEKECAAYLPQATPLLIKGTPISIINLTAEERNYFGSTDYIVAANMQTDIGGVEAEVSIWEVKAPQCYLMERDDNSTRCRPTRELVKAENQLLHYAYEAMLNDAFRLRYRVM
jgi:hypothetical protein